MKTSRIFILLYGLLIFTALDSQSASAQTTTPCDWAATSNIEASDILACLQSSQSINIDNAHIIGDLDLTSLSGTSQYRVITNRLTIINSRFTGSIRAYDGDHKIAMVFQEQVDLRGSQFDGTVDFTSATFKEFAHFENTHFGSEANFNQVEFQEGVSFTNAIFDTTSTFMLAKIFDGADFSNAQFHTLANFSFLHTFQNADSLSRVGIIFSDARFLGKVNFMNAAFDNQVLFNNANFQRQALEDTVNFNDASFKALDLSAARFEKGQLVLNIQNYERLKMPNFHPEILSDQTDLDRLFLLEENFRKQGRLDIACAIAYWRLCTLRAEKSFLRQTMETVFLDWTFGYGYKPAHALVTSTFLILFFSLFYLSAGTLRFVPLAPQKPRERNWLFRLSEIPIAHKSDRTSCNKLSNHHIHGQVSRGLQAIAFSFGVFTKIGSGQYVAVRYRSMVVAEWVIGLIMMAGFLYTLANTNPLIHSIFSIFG